MLWRGAGGATSLRARTFVSAWTVRLGSIGSLQDKGAHRCDSAVCAVSPGPTPGVVRQEQNTHGWTAAGGTPCVRAPRCSRACHTYQPRSHTDNTDLRPGWVFSVRSRIFMVAMLHSPS
jgi:hypothetical protein